MSNENVTNTGSQAKENPTTFLTTTSTVLVKLGAVVGVICREPIFQSAHHHMRAMVKKIVASSFSYAIF